MVWWWRLWWRSLSSTTNPSTTTTPGTLLTTCYVSLSSLDHHQYSGVIYSGEFSNHVLLGLQFYLTDIFLGGKFSSYGWDTLDYYSHPLRDRQSSAGGLRNPMCSLFPTEVSCSVPVVGASGGEQSSNGLCVLTQVTKQWQYHLHQSLYQNIINEKIYLLLWFWYIFLLCWSVISSFFLIATLFFDHIRFILIYKGVCDHNVCNDDDDDDDDVFRCDTDKTRQSGSVCSTSWSRVRWETGSCCISSARTATPTSSESSSGSWLWSWRGNPRRVSLVRRITRHFHPVPSHTGAPSLKSEINDMKQW